MQYASKREKRTTQIDNLHFLVGKKEIRDNMIDVQITSDLHLFKL